MTPSFGKPTRILAVADEETPGLALQSALHLADHYKAEIEVMACVDRPHDLSILSRIAHTKPERLLEEAVERTRQEVGQKLREISPDREIPLTVSVGKAYLQIIQHVAQTGVDLVIKKAEPLRGFDRFLLSSTDQHLLRKCPCPVWLQTPTAPPKPRRFLATIDLDVADAAEPETLSDLNRRVVLAACNLAVAPDAEVIVLHAWDAIGAGIMWAFAGGSDARLSSDTYINEILAERRRALDRFLRQIREEIGPHPRLVPCLARGTPETVISQQRRKFAADVVVIGTVARTGLSGVFIGNTAENIINTLDCPVLAVKPGGFVSPLLNGR